MTMAMTENPALLDPVGTLTEAQRRALKLLDGHAHPAKLTRSGWEIAGKRFSKETATVLRRYGLANCRQAARLTISDIGRLAVSRMGAKP